MDIYEEAAQRAWQAVFARVKDLLAEGKKPADISRMLGHKGRSAVTNWIGEKVTAEKAEFPDMLRYMGVLGLNPMDYIPNIPTIRRLGNNAPTELIKGEDLPTVPVLGSAGAGDAVEFFSAEPERFIQVLKQYAIPNVVALHVEGESMEPTIRKGSYVGIAPMNDRIVEGNIYLVNLPYLGRVVKRIRMRGDGMLEMYSDNPNFDPQPLPNDGYENIIVGRVVWIWQLC